jgi:hypothetical protein
MVSASSGFGGIGGDRGQGRHIENSYLLIIGEAAISVVSARFCGESGGFGSMKK